MDTGSHLLFGATLAGLAYLDPAVAGQPELAGGILAATLLGSHAPDLDTVTRLVSYNCYVRNHRGVTHSLPALLIWPLVIAGPISLAIGASSAFWHLYGWAMAAVILHVVLDLCNAYGVQCLRPLNRFWHHLDLLALTDPFLITLHAGGLVVWWSGAAAPGGLFAILYGITAIYIFCRWLHHRLAVLRVKRHFGEESGVCHLVPGMHWFRWQFIMETKERYYTGTIRGGVLTVRDLYEKQLEHPAAQATLGSEAVRAFLHFAQKVHVTIRESAEGYQVEWRDVRFWYNHKLPFGADVKLDRNLKVMKEHLGWRKKAWDPPYV